MDGALCVTQVRVQCGLLLELHTVDAEDDAIDKSIAVRRVQLSKVKDEEVAAS